jgi:hypothetical protein
MYQATTNARPALAPAAAPARARRVVWLSFWLMIVTVVVGRAWDGYWHITRPFDGFWSPPHVFVYAMSTLAGLIAARLAFDPALRRCFGPGFALPLLPFVVPGSLFLLGSGFVALGVAGMILDNIWHSSFGLNETAWSLPHAMIGGALAVMVCGFVACRLALTAWYPLRWYTKLWLGFLLIGCAGTFLGPIGGNHTEDTVRATAQLPILRQQWAWLQTHQLTLRYDLTRANPALLVLGPLWAGIALGLLRELDPRRRMLLATVLCWLWITENGDRNAAEWLDRFYPLLHDPANWQALPLLPAAIVLVGLQALRVPERPALGLAGIVFAGLCAVIWPPASWSWLLVPLAAPALIGGAGLGRRVWAVIAQPTAAHAWTLALIVVLGVPTITGLVDLWLRLR